MIKNTNKSKFDTHILITVLSLGIIVFSYIISQPILVLVGVVLICGTIIFSDSTKATYLILIVTSSSPIMMYNETTYFILIVAVYVMTLVFKGRFLKGSLFVLSLCIYSLIFSNSAQPFKVSALTTVIYISFIVFICDNIYDTHSLRKAIDYYIEGFGIAAFIGLAAERIPNLQYDRSNQLIIDGQHMGISRFGGLYQDPNYFSAMNCIAIAAILFTNKKLSIKQLALLAFLIILGFFTYSKSYVLTLAFIVLIYVFKSGRNVLKKVCLILGLLVALILVENILNLNMITLVLSRFNGVETADELTTGRWKIWMRYLEYIFSDIKILLFGDGFNAKPVFTELDSYRATHNVFIEFLFRFGVVGCALWGWCIKTCFNSVASSVNFSRERLTIVPLLTYLAVYSFLSAFSFGYLGISLCVAIFAYYLPREEFERVSEVQELPIPENE